MFHKCAWSGCSEEGEFRAPVDPRDLSQVQYFCAEHIKRFNKQWNGLKGLSVGQVWALQDGAATWNRPTRPMGVQGGFGKYATFGFNSVDDLFTFFQQRNATMPEGTAAHQGMSSANSLPRDVQAACAMLELQAPLQPEELKQHYRALIKQHHPDLQTEESEDTTERVKEINVAYKILKEWVEPQS